MSCFVELEPQTLGQSDNEIVPGQDGCHAYVDSWLERKRIGITRSKVSIRGIADLLRLSRILGAIGPSDRVRLSQKWPLGDTLDEITGNRLSVDR